MFFAMSDVNVITINALDGLFSNLEHTLVVIVLVLSMEISIVVSAAQI